MRWRCVGLCFLALALVIVDDVQARLVRNHVSSICSTWGREHFKTFDGDVFQFPAMCEYNLVSDCHESYQEFSVHMRRRENDGDPTVSYVVVTIGELSFHLSKTLVTVNNEPVKLPYHNAGVQVEKNAVYLKLQSKVGITVMWNADDAILVELDQDYANRTCGLCGDFNGVSVYNEFIHNGRQISSIEFGNKHKIHNPNEDCEDPYEEDYESLDAVSVADSCTTFQTTCNQMLRSESWSSCIKLIDPEPYIQACVQDMCGCTNKTNDFCVCSTMSEFSRQCSHAGGQPPSWRTPQFCAKQCPFNMVYEESGSPCLDTCSHQDTSSLCEDHKMDGCFCPPGTVFDDISIRGCIIQSACQCKHNKVYNSGEVYRQDRSECTCLEGRWACKSLQTPATCAVEEGSHVTTFDGKTFTFHGDCYYILAKDDTSPKFTILIQLVPCANQEFDTCLKTLKILLNNDRNNVLTFTSDGKVKQNTQTISLPYQALGDINIFQASSFHILLQTSFGLQVQIQHVPVMQVYVSLDPSYRGNTRGLCGNYNMVLSDDMKTPQGIVEGTAVTFSNSWKANLMCRDRDERLDDPCSLSVENELYAKHWCALLLEPNSPFAQCHSAVDPEMYHKRCTYASCNCEKSEACLCAVLSSYARACAARGVFLKDWRENVCDKYSRSCPASQTFSNKHQRCQLTCSSLGSNQQSCSSDFLPVDGCSCSEGLYLNEKGTCVPMAKCPCYYNEAYIKPGKSISIKDEHCVCNNGILHCHSWRARLSKCPSPKEFFNCSSPGKGELGVQCARTCLNLDNNDCDFTECESGCQCPSGLVDDGKGSCVREKECPCQHDGHLYAAGAQIPNKCNTCTCKSGKWECTEKKCPGTCTIYGSGHYSTFDEQTYAFQGDCAYIAVKNKCGNKTVEYNFGIITENVPCGSTGTTCSKTIRIQLGRTEIKLAKGKYERMDEGPGPDIPIKIRQVGLYLVVESSIGVAVMWDRKTTVRILLEPQHSGKVCGLCGDFDGDVQNDFTTQGQLEVSTPTEFANSWKVHSSCPDAETSVDPCKATPNRHHWAKSMCSIITGPTFRGCHNKVNPLPFYENCVKDSCACDTGGDCECFCTAVAAYAQACNEAEVCIAWRTPDICPVFCDYYNNPDDCKWHYNPCHKPCYKTCLNPEGNCTNPIPNLEGCYPVCPEDKPIFDEDNQICVALYSPTNWTSNSWANYNHRVYNPSNQTSYYNCGANHNHICHNPITSYYNNNHKVYNPRNQTTYDNCRAIYNHKVYNHNNQTSYYNFRANHNHRQNETFFICNCTMAKCIENDTIVIVPYECPPIEPITCTNGGKPVLVYDEYYCCQHYACDCVCEGWGDPHYITFDGLFYSYQGNCTYILMQEISPKHKLKIYIDNVFCDPTEDVSCPRSLIISYNSQMVKLINHNLMGAAQLEALKNGIRLKLPYSQDGVKILNSGINMILEIPRLRVIITFGITGFSITLPFQNFGQNTQGHCGTCDNNQANDCMLPGGQLIESCAVMADFWLAKDISPPSCELPSVLPTKVPPPPTDLIPCKPDSMCDLLRSSIFAECHPVVSIENFYRGCVFDSCHVSNPVVECTSLQTYAAACAQAGVCLNWRNHTTLCASGCPSNTVYKPCGPVEQPTCEDNPEEVMMNYTTEGCFCPDGMKLFNKDSGVCVDKCGCLDPEGIPREFDEQFEYKCQNCICKESTKTVTCKPKVCPEPPAESCSGPGFILVNKTNPSDSCCYSFVCQCQSSTCPVISMKCAVGHMPVVSVPEGKCCLEHTCEPKRVCVHRGAEYQPGSTVPVQICQDCTCSNKVDSHSGLFQITCELQQCQETCDKGYEYMETDPEVCCGKCVQTHCEFSLNGTKQLLMPGKTWSPPENMCEHYTCIKSGETLLTTSSHIVCPPFQQSNCQPDTIQTAANGCCKICMEKERACKLVPMKIVILQNGCQSSERIAMPYCEGSCNTFTKYSEAAAALQQSCSCCKETQASRRTVDLHCLNGDVVPYTYTHVDECGCGHTDCTTLPGKSARRRRSFTLV
ncbi:mucin-2 [Hippoglossus stenolepis]|uniref:mucin-2 n=1 Tax=Hippoglossus stenolepis TaxID=195615 RepID=UPI001FAFA861|nr:mucin-2 [Hippoglossus stenolepis]